MNDPQADFLRRVQQRAAQELNDRDMEGHKVAWLGHRHIQALKDGQWSVVLDELDRQSHRTIRSIWLMAAFLVVATAGHAVYTVSGIPLAWSEALWMLLIPGLWLAYGIYAVWATTKRLQHLERARMALEIARDTDKNEQDTAETEL